jgi:histidinol dehydrogenase
MRWWRSGTAAYREALARAESRGATDSAKVSAVVAEVIARVRFDPGRKGFAVPPREIDAAWRRVPASLRASLEVAAGRIGAFHRNQLDDGFTASIPGASLAQRVLPVSRAGVYVPGGKAAYPSTLLMNAIPAGVAGVPEVVAACSAPGGRVPDVVLAAARIAG